MTNRGFPDIISNVDCQKRNHGSVRAGVAELADALDLGSSVARRMSSSLFARTIPMYAVVAQLVERHLAKVEVASPSLVYRSICTFSSVGRAPDS